MTSQQATLNCRLDDLEDRARRNNVIFHAIPDSRETWAQTEEKTLAAISSALGSDFPPSAVERAHRLGVFSDAKCRPVIMKLNNFKEKDKIFSLRPKLKKMAF